MAAGPRRVVITGVGLVAPVGVGWRAVWREVLAGRPRISALTSPDYARLPCRIAGLIPDSELAAWPHWDPNVPSPGGRLRDMSRASALALAAAREAFDEAGVRPGDIDGDSLGVAIGCGMDGLEAAVDAGAGLRDQKRGYSAVGPHFLTRLLNNMPAGRVALEFGAKGPNLAPNTACASGADAIGAAFRLVRDGYADAMLCGGTEACVGPLAMAAFARIRALASGEKFNAKPNAASRPFDAARCGFVMSEGAGVLLLESLEGAVARGAPAPLAELLGFGSAADAHHLTAPDPEGSGALRCMTAAVRDARRFAASAAPIIVGHVSAHATSTPIGDAAEWRAILAAASAGHLRPGCLVTASKGALGHLIGAAGAVEAALAALACRDGLVPPTANLEAPDVPEVEAEPPPPRLVPAGPAVEWPSIPDTDGLRIALSNSFGFGGVNASLCIANFVP